MNTPAAAARRLPRFAEAAVERARLTVVAPVRSRAPRAPFAVLVALLLGGGVIGLLVFNTHMQQISFEATALQQRADDLDARRQSLAMELDELRDPQRLAEQAKALGMVAPQTPAFLRLDDGSVLGEPAPATPEGAVRINALPAPKPAVIDPPPLVIRVPGKPVTAPVPAAGEQPAAQKPAAQKPAAQKPAAAQQGTGR